MKAVSCASKVVRVMSVDAAIEMSGESGENCALAAVSINERELHW